MTQQQSQQSKDDPNQAPESGDKQPTTPKK
ncbi:hypothetical protein C7M51_00814 [Mixta intestinalis]|jgi:hypothetical protein|uniref:Uncharacterized protein n=1 Tax=Mixta intestinalis TaxID=1615494 RepID=A0A6P1PXF4_9GAMM|nr:hypothetical protein C7M51_00814 [Mixta intestinalis]